MFYHDAVPVNTYALFSLFLKQKLYNRKTFKTVHNAIKATSSSDKDSFKGALNFIE